MTLRLKAFQIDGRVDMLCLHTLTQRIWCSGECSNVLTRVRVPLTLPWLRSQGSAGQVALEVGVSLKSHRKTTSHFLANPLAKRKKSVRAWPHQKHKSISHNVQMYILVLLILPNTLRTSWHKHFNRLLMYFYIVISEHNIML